MCYQAGCHFLKGLWIDFDGEGIDKALQSPDCGMIFWRVWEPFLAHVSLQRDRFWILRQKPAQHKFSVRIRHHLFSVPYSLKADKTERTKEKEKRVNRRTGGVGLLVNLTITNSVGGKYENNQFGDRQACPTSNHPDWRRPHRFQRCGCVFHPSAHRARVLGRITISPTRETEVDWLASDSLECDQNPFW